ncbi:hypothetical protein KSP40_PGU010845 [Platanthera guangdongensis]|uniref:succinate dehydrogenase n=1 Tax=Platanthera guangdongensis TaxID=2320717 RepID=A0ABR2MQM4_9ASPA
MVRSFSKLSPEKKKLKEFKIYRWSPDFQEKKPLLHSYHVDLSTYGPMYAGIGCASKDKGRARFNFELQKIMQRGYLWILLNEHRWKQCACMPQAVNTNTSAPTVITALPHMFVIKDLVVDLTAFYQQYKSIEPWLKTRKTPENYREHLQSPRDRNKLDGLYECILCACCSTACPAYWWNQEKFLGPAALLNGPCPTLGVALCLLPKHLFL